MRNFVLLLIPIIFMVFTGFGHPDTDSGDVDLDKWFDFTVIFFAFGPGLYFLYADRIRSTKPNLPDQVEGQEILENESAAQ